MTKTHVSGLPMLQPSMRYYNHMDYAFSNYDLLQPIRVFHGTSYTRQNYFHILLALTALMCILHLGNSQSASTGFVWLGFYSLYHFIIMKFALYEFCEDQSCAVGESSWMVNEDDTNFNNNVWITNKEVLVHWPKAPKDYLKWSNKNGKYSLDTEWKTYTARVLRFHGKLGCLIWILHSFSMRARMHASHLPICVVCAWKCLNQQSCEKGQVLFKLRQ